MNLNPSLEHVDQLLALVADELAELLGRARADPGDDRDHPLPAKLRAQIVIIVIRRVDPKRVLDAADAAACRDLGLLALTRLGYQSCHTNVQPLAQLLDLLILN